MKTTASLFASALVLYASQAALAVDPPPDGGYPNGNTAEGEDALFSILSFSDANTAIGYHALYSADYGSSNTAIGWQALAADHGDYYNTAVGAEALSRSDCGAENTVVGYSAMAGTRCGSENVAIGSWAMANGSGFSCVAIGSQSLMSNTGELNTAVGHGSMIDNISGKNNTAVGWSSLAHNITGSYNAALGLDALPFNTTGSYNSVVGSFSATYNTEGSNLVSVGFLALNANTRGSDNTAVGASALSNNIVGNGNIALGSGAGSNVRGSDNIDIGNSGSETDKGVIRIGTTGTHRGAVIAGIENATIARGRPVIVSHAGRLGIATSSARYKEAIKPMEKSSEAILSLKPVSFRYKKELDPEAIPQFGLVAEEVAKIDPDLIDKDEQGKPYAVRYEAVNAMLLNEFLKEHRKVEILETSLEKLETIVKHQGAQLQEVRDQIQASKSVPRLVSSNE